MTSGRKALYGIAKLFKSDARVGDRLPYDRLIDDRLRALYYLDYSKANEDFRELTDRFPASPLGPYAVATGWWWELTNEFDERNPALEKQFLAAADRAVKEISLGEKKATPRINFGA